MYPGIGLSFYGRDSRLEYDFDLQPGADADALHLQLTNLKAASLTSNGDLLLQGKDRSATFLKPVAYQIAADGKTRKEVTVDYALSVGKDKADIRFTVGAYDHSRTLVIDPVLTYGQFLPVVNGGYLAAGLAVDTSGNTYVLMNDNFNGFAVTEVNAAGAIVSTSSVGNGSTGDNAFALAIDAAGNAYVTGSTNGLLPTTANAFQTSYSGNQDSFLTVIQNGGSNLIYSSYFGGTGTEVGQGVAVDASGNAYVVGYTTSTDLQTTSGVYQATNPKSGGVSSGYVAKFNPNLSGAASLVYSTYVGGIDGGADDFDAIALDSAGNAYLTGYAYLGFPVTSSINYSGIYTDGYGAYVIKLNPTATSLVYSAYLGPGNGSAIALDGNDDAYVAGKTSAEDFPVTSGAYQTTYPGAFATELSADGNSLIYSTFIGGPSSANTTNVTPSSIALPVGCKSACAAAIAGYTSTVDFPLVNPIQSTPAPNAQNAFLLQLNGAGSAATFSTYVTGSLGGLNGQSFGQFVAIDGSNNLLFAMSGAVQSDYPVSLPVPSNVSNVYLEKISPSNGSLVLLTPAALNLGDSVVGVTSTPAAAQATLENVGTTAVTLQPFTFSDTEFAETDNCGTSLAAAAQCAIQFSFTPAGDGARNATFSVASTAPNSPTTVALTGNGTDSPVLQLSPTSVSFGDQAVGTTSAPQTVTVTNIGDLPYTISSSTFDINSYPVGGAFSAVSTCPASLAPGASCSVGITFTPLQTGFSGANFSPGYSTTLSLSGNGVAGGNSGTLTAYTDAVNIGNVILGQSLSGPGFFFYNNSTVPVSIFNVAFSQNGATNYANDFVLNYEGCVPGTLAPQSLCEITYTFTPSIVGTETVNLNVTNSTSTTPLTATVSGTGIAVAQTLTFSPASVVFPDQPIGNPSNTQNIYVFNTGDVSFPVDRIEASGDYSITNQGCTGGNIAPSGDSYSCFVSVAFTPTATGTRTGTLTIYDAAGTSPQVVSLVGVGVPATGSFALQNNSLTFAAQAQGTSSAYQPIYLLNTGNSPVAVKSIAFTGDFASSYNSCNAVIQPGNQCEVDVVFTPTQASGTETGTLVISTAAGNYTVTLQGTAEIATQAIGFTPTAVNFGTIQVNGSTNTLPGLYPYVFVRNTGTEPISFSAAPAVSANFQIVSNGCGSTGNTLAPGASCQLYIGFTAPATAGTYTGTLTFTDSAGTGTQTINLTGTATAALPNVELGPSYLAFDQEPVGATSGLGSNFAIFINNTATGINFSSVVTSGDFMIPTGYDYCLTSGASPNSLCYVYVQFAPTASGYRTGSLTLTDSSNKVYTIPLSGYAPVDSNSASLSNSNLAFADEVAGVPLSSINADAVQIVRLQNNGNLPLTVGALTGSVSGTFSLQSPGVDECSGTTVQPASSCYIEVSFAPATTGNKTGSISFPVTYANATTATLTLTLSGNGIAPLEHATLSPASTPLLNQVVGIVYPGTGSNGPVFETFTNDGNITLTVGQVTLSDTTDFSFYADECSTRVLAPGATCQVYVTFQPGSTGAKTNTLTVPVHYSDASNTPASFTSTQTGTGIAAKKSAILSPSVSQLPVEVVNTQDTSTYTNFTVTNTSNESVVLGTASVSASFAIPYDNCSGDTLPPQGFCSLYVILAPTSTSGSYTTTHYTGTLSVPVTGGTTLTAALSGTGIPASAQVTLSQSVVNFGSVNVTNSSPVIAVPLVNQGPTGSSVSVSGIVLGGANASDFQLAGGSCAVGSTLYGRSSCLLNVVFSPAASSTGARTATITITYTGVSSQPSGTLVLTMNGTGTNPVPQATVFPTTLTFGSQAVNTTSPSQSFSVTNTGSANLVLGTLSFNNSTIFPVVSNACNGATLTPTQSCVVSIAFDPTTGGAVSGQVTIPNNATTQTVTLTGTGAGGPVLSGAPATLTFASQPVSSTSAAQTITLKNSGGGTLTLSEILATGNFVQSNTCTAGLTGTGTCSVSVTFTPTTVGANTGTLYFYDNATGSPQTVTLSGTGTQDSQTITFGSLPSIAYGTSPITLTATASSGLPVSYAVTGPATISGSTLSITGAGTVKVTASQAGNTNYAPATSVSQSFSVTPANLTVTANNAFRLYGAINPAFTYTVTGFVNGDTSSVISGSATETTSATTSSAPGTYPITFATEGLTAANYTFAYVSGTLTVNGGASQTITFGALGNQVYGVAPITLTATASSGLAVSYSVTGPASVSGSTLTVTGTGTVKVTASQAGNTEYNAATPVSQSFTVTSAVLTVTASSLSRAYGAVNPALTYAVTGFVNGDTSAVVAGSATLTTTASPSSPAGTYPITFSTEALTATNYTFNYVAGVLTVNGGVAQTITFGALPNVTYGVSPITLTATASSGLPVSYTVTGPATVSGSTLTITGAGSVTVTAAQAGNSNYAAATPVPQSFTVAQAALTVTANNQSRPYGAANPALTYSVAGFVNGDTSAVISGTATLATTANSTSSAGTYPITFVTEALTATNYTVTYVAGALTVSGGVAQTITFGALPNVTYGVSPITLTATASSGLPVSYTATGPATVSGSTLTITGTGTVTVTASQAGNSNYAAATTVSQSFSVGKASLTVTANNQSRQAGAANPALTYTLTGFVDGDTSAVVSGTATLTTTATTSSPAGAYPITFSTEGLTATNYTFTYVSGTLTVSGGEAQTITFSPLSNQTYGAAPITLTATASSGLAVSYTVTGPATVSGSTLTITGAGSVTVTAAQAGNATYAAATPVAQSFTVNPAALTVTAASLSRPYNTANPAFTYAITGFVNGDTSSVVSGTATLTTTATTTSPAGTYPITFATEGLTASNYTFAYVGGTLTVSGGVAQTITFGALPNVTYGVSPITLTATASSGLAVTYTVTGPATVFGTTLTVTGAGTVTVTASQAGNSNYAAATSVSQSFNVAQASLTVTANNQSRQAGAANPALTYSITGFVNGDTSTVVSGTATLTTTATTSSPAGSYPITFATEALTASNYTFTYIAGTLIVSGGETQTIAFGALANETYGASPITLTATASSGLPVSYTVTGPASVSGSTLTITGAGLVKVTASQSGNATYAAAAPVSQSFTVNPAALTVTANNQSRGLGAANPTLTYAITGFVNGDTATVVSGTATLATSATTTSPAGTYPITFTTETLAAANYTFTYVAGTLTVTSSGPQVQLTPSSLVFPSTAVGSTATYQEVTVTNTGNSVLNISSFSIVDTASFYSWGIREQTCGTTLAAGSSCTFYVAFRPTGAGTLTAQIAIADNASNSPQLVSLTGTGRNAPFVELSTTSLVFPSTKVGDTASYQQIKVTNSGNATLNISAIEVTNTTSFYSWGIREQTCGATLAAGSSCTFSVAFRPITKGQITADISIVDNASLSPQKISLTGTGTP